MGRKVCRGCSLEEGVYVGVELYVEDVDTEGVAVAELDELYTSSKRGKNLMVITVLVLFHFVSINRIMTRYNLSRRDAFKS